MISFVYFDVGGVVIRDISDQKSWDEMKKDIGVPIERFDEWDQFWDKHDPKLNTSTKVDELIPLMESQFGIQFPKNYSFQKDLLIRFKKNQSIWPIINEVKKHSPIGLLTNMYPEMLDAIHTQGLMPPVKWDIVVDSSIVGYQKPDREMYEIATKMCGFKTNEILFIDNSSTNIQAASSFGWQTFLYDPLNLEDSNSSLLELLDTKLFKEK